MITMHTVTEPARTAGSSLTAATGLATAAILIASAVTGFRALASGTLTPPAPIP